MKNFYGGNLTRTFLNDDDIYVCSMYLPPQSSSYQKRITSDYFLRLEDEILKYNSLGKVILCGDMNARTRTEPDYINSTKNPLDLTSAHLTDIDSTLHQSNRCSRDQIITNLSNYKYRIRTRRLNTITCLSRTLQKLSILRKEWQYQK